MIDILVSYFLSNKTNSRTKIQILIDVILHYANELNLQTIDNCHYDTCNISKKYDSKVEAFFCLENFQTFWRLGFVV